MSGETRTAESHDPLELPLEGSILIEASAGTGKTYTITTLVLRLLIEAQLEISSLLVLTYTRAATAELRDRVRRRIAEAQRALEQPEPPSDETLARIWHARKGSHASDARRLGVALRDFDRAPIFTIHGFCQRVLGEHALESKLPFDVTLIEDTSVLVDDAVHDFLVSYVDGLEPRIYGAQKKAGIHVGALTKIARLVVREPEIPILPARVDAAIDASVFDAADRAIARVARAWHQHKHEVLPLICNEAVMNQSTFKASRILDRWVPELDDLHDAGYLAARTHVERLSQDNIRESTKKAKQAVSPKHAFFGLCADALPPIARADEQTKAAALRAKLALVARARTDVARAKRRASAQAFDDLLLGLLAALRGSGGAALARSIARRYPVLLVDEFQDTDPAQLEVFQRIHAGGGRLLAYVGDPKQAIYGFRGADVFAYVAAAEALAAEGGAKLPLSVSRRADPTLVRALNFVFRRIEKPFGDQAIAYPPLDAAKGARDRLSPPGPALELLLLPRTSEDSDDDDDDPDKARPDREKLPDLIANEITLLLQSGMRIEASSNGSESGQTERPIEPRDLAVLCRTNAQGLEVQAALSARGVPAALDGDSTVVFSPTSDELARVLRAMAEPSDREAVCSALATRLLGFTAQALYELGQNDRAFEQQLELFASVSQVWHERGFVQAAHYFLAEAGVRQRLLAEPDGARQLTDLLHLIELLHLEAMRDHLGPLALVQRFEALRATPKPSGGLGAESTQLRLESDERAVRITTIHRSKGLEYPIVFCPYLWSPPFFISSDPVLFHDPDDEHRMKLDLGSDEIDAHRKLAQKEALADALRLTYVALTRAKHRVYVVVGKFRRFSESPIARLLALKDAGKGGSPSNKSTAADAELLAQLMRLADESAGALGVRVLPTSVPSDAPRYASEQAEAPALAARTFARELGSGERLSSFSRITRSAHKLEVTPLRAAPDSLLETVSDEDDTPDALLVQARAQPVALPALPLTLHDFPAGPGPGTLLHAIYEHVDFERAAQPDDPSLRAEVERWLGRGRIDAARFAEPLERGIRQSLLAPLSAHDHALTLAGVNSRERLNELEFTLPTPPGARVSPASIAALLEQHGSGAVRSGYSHALSRLGERCLQGYLRGFIDLVFRKDGRFYLLDYKSNHLGPHASDYGSAQLAVAMAEHHYFLQYHLYVLALHRYLRARQPGYDYERAFGGVLYAFVRGMSKAHPAGHGVYFDRPSLALVEALDALFASPSAAGGTP